MLQKAELLRTTQGSTLTKINRFISELPAELCDHAKRTKLRALESWDGKEKFASVFGQLLPHEILDKHGERLNEIMNPPKPEQLAAA